MRLLTLFCGLAVLVAAGTSSAAPVPPPSGTLTVQQPAAAGAPFQISGCGYQPSSPLLVTLHMPFSQLDGQNVTADTGGCFSTLWVEPYQGAYYADSYMIRKNGKSLIWAAEALFSLT